MRKLREADRMLGDRRLMVEVCKHLEFTEQRYYRWWNQYGGLKADDAKPRPHHDWTSPDLFS